jgi:nucleoside-diphosphate-sugar epimerase
VASASDRGRVLVTGSGGFTGRFLSAELCRNGYRVIEPRESDCDLRAAADVLRYVRESAPDYVVHLAAISYVPHGSPEDFYTVNSVGTSNLLKALEPLKGLRKVILASTAQVYAPADGTDALDETAPLRPASHYACSKLAMEFMAATWTDRLPIVITRPFNYTGAGQPEHFVVPKIVAHHARRERSIRLGNLDVSRDFFDVRAVADAYCRLLESPSRTGVFNICSGTSRSLRSILAEVERLSGWQLEIEQAEALVRSNDAPRVTGSNVRLRREIGALGYMDFTATLSWMLAAAQSASEAQ